MVAVQGADPGAPGESGAVQVTRPVGHADGRVLFLRLTGFVFSNINVILGSLGINYAAMATVTTHSYFCLCIWPRTAGLHADTKVI